MTNGRNGMMGTGLSFLAGCLVGGIAGVFYAPHSGMRTRRQLANLAEDVKEKAGEVTDDAAAAVHKIVERGRHLINA